MIWPLSLLTRASKGADLTPTEADTIVSSIQKAVNAALVGWGKDESATTGLIWGYLGGQAWSGSAWSTVAAGTVSLAASATNYIQRTIAGVVSVNQTGWTAGSIPMFQVVTTGSGVMSWTDMRAESIPAAFLGTALGIATLDSGGKVPTAQLPASVLGSLKYQGTWNASTNSPALASGVGTTGFYYIVGTAGSTAIDGVSSWKIGDWITFDGTKWDKVDNSVTPLATATPQPLGTAAVGTSGNAAREDHVHQAVPVFGASGGSHASGLVPDPGPTAGTVKNLREDGTWALREYDIGGGCTGKPSASAVILRMPAVRAFTLPTNLSGSQGKAGAAATASATFNIAKNGTNIGTMVFAASATTPTFTLTATSFGSGDVLTVTAPSSQDATLSDLGFVLAGSMA